MNNIKLQVAEDQVKQYNIALQSGTKMDICVHAQMVSAAYLQAEDQDQYRDWKLTERKKCRAAGLPDL